MTDTDSRGYLYSKKCWSCGSFKMEDKGAYVKCQECGATWNPMSLIQGPLTKPDNITHMIDGEAISMRAKHPSTGVKRRAARARKVVS